MINRRSYVFASGLGVLLFLGACGGKQAKWDNIMRGELMGVIEKAEKAFEAEDLQGLMEHWHKDSPQYGKVKEVLPKFWAECELNTTREKKEIIAWNPQAGDAVVRFVESSRKVNCREYRDNRVQGLLIMKRDDERWQWKIFEEVVEKREYLEGE